MKKLFYIFQILVFFIIFPSGVFAASFSLKADANQVKSGDSFQVSVGGDCIGRVNLTVSNGTLSNSTVWVEQNYQTVRVTANGKGNVVVTATPEKGFSDPDANEYNPGKKSVTVKLTQSNSNSKQPSQKPTADTKKPTTNTTISKSSDYFLSSLRVGLESITPEFQKDVTSYSVSFSSDVDSIVIEGEASDSKAQVSGLGEKELNVGENVFDIVVCAENGEKKTYQVHAYKEEEPTVFLSYNQEKIGVLTYVKDVLIPEPLKKEDYSIDETEVPVFANADITLVYGVNENQEKGFYLLNESKKECVSQVTPLKLMNQNFYSVDSKSLENLEGFTVQSLDIKEQTIPGYVFQNGYENYYLLSLLNDQGEKVNYLYEKSEGTLQLYSNQALLSYQEQERMLSKVDFYQKLCIILGIFLFIFLCLFLLFMIRRKGERHEITI